MGRRIGMWTAMISVLVVGVSLTKMTNDFVSSNGVEAAAITSVMDKSIPLTSGMEAVEPAEETVGELFAITEAAPVYDVMPAAEAAPAAEFEESFEVYGPGMDSAVSDDIETEEADSEIYEEVQAAEAVKSPLDPEIETEGPFAEDSFINTEMDVEYFMERFSSVETSTAALWDMVSPEHSGAYYTAAEQEHVLWEHELNLVFSTVRDCLFDEEAEALNVQEAEWMKERERYANKYMSSVKNKAVQSAEYLQALTLMTKERCYWFIDEYGEFLNSKE